MHVVCLSVCCKGLCGVVCMCVIALLNVSCLCAKCLWWLGLCLWLWRMRPYRYNYCYYYYYYYRYHYANFSVRPGFDGQLGRLLSNLMAKGHECNTAFAALLKQGKMTLI